MSMIYDVKNRKRKPTASDAVCAFIPYARQAIDGEDIRAVQAVLESDWLTRGRRSRNLKGSSLNT